MSDAVSAYVAEILQSQRNIIACHRELPAAEAEYGQNHLPWSAATGNLLSARGISLYSHQALATDHIRAGHSVVVATPTASGKSLIYNLPVLEQHLRDPDATALYLFPLKALAQDQFSAFSALAASWPDAARPKAAIYDGDTSDYQRRKIRNEPPSVLITNPEMLHLGILPHHASWTTFLANLSHIVVDEAHTYRGVFGAHMAQVFRRLNRVAARYGARPAYVFCTATLGNPAELASALMGSDAPPVLIDKSGAPQGKRHFIFVNPDLAASTCAIDLLKRALARNLRVIVYCQSRRMAELISLWASQDAGQWRGKIAAYRAGYLPEERREIEARMASGQLLAVVSTSALELGIDIGGLDVCILAGYPGSVTQTLQRGGRVGRSGRESAVLLVSGEDALDQYFMRHPRDFFARPAEKAAVNPFNAAILKKHLECAAAEQPLTAAEPWLGHAETRGAISELEAQGLLARSADGSQWVAMRKRPHRDVDLRGCGQSFTLENADGQIIGMMDGIRAWKEAHPGAIYLHRGRTWISREIDAGRARIIMEPARVAWHTRARSRKETVILEEYGRQAFGRAAVFSGRLRISEHVTGYEKRSGKDNRLISVTPLDSPVQVFETDGLWYIIPDAIRISLESQFLHFMGSIHALEHAAIGLLPLAILADRNDFGGISTPLHPQLGLPAVFIYDGIPGGAGLATSAFACARDILQSTCRAIADCPCEDGCPSCIQSPKCGSGNRPLSKAGSLRLLEEMLAEGDEGGEICKNLQISPPPDILPPSAGTPAGAAITLGASQPRAANALQTAHAENMRAQPLPEQSFTPAKPPPGYVVFDVETRRGAAEVGGWHKAYKMGVSVAVLYDGRSDSFFSYSEEELPEMLARMAAAEAVVGFNSIRFDYRVLQPFARGQLAGLRSIDLLKRIHERSNLRISLDNLARATLGAPKSASGLQALKWWQEGEIEKIASYCRKDVELTRDLYLFGLQNGYLLYASKAGATVRVPVDFRI